MKKAIIILALLASSCSPTEIVRNTPVVGDVCTLADRTLIDEKVVFAAEVIYNIPAHAYFVADQNGKLTQDVKFEVKPMLRKLNNLRNAVFAAKGTLTCDFNNMKQLQVEIIQLLPKE